MIDVGPNARSQESNDESGDHTERRQHCRRRRIEVTGQRGTRNDRSDGKYDHGQQIAKPKDQHGDYWRIL